MVSHASRINIHNKSSRLNSRDEYRTQRPVLDQHAGFNYTTSNHSSSRPPLIRYPHELSYQELSKKDQCEIAVCASPPCIAVLSKCKSQTLQKHIASLASRSHSILVAQVGQ
ncbi:hypothetical protein M405DRAFT_822844 [Rhizopogon salebrosus TDB-379]|nr:hypothetical protein M405DRAFT_822844 [Rhizopogon salebrosus TDB-379]